MQKRRKYLVLMAEDDIEDQMLMREAFERVGFAGSFRFVNDGDELLDYLNGRGQHAGAPRPDLVLVDINMPGRNGHEVVRQIKRTPALRAIPVVMMTTSGQEEDVIRSYNQGANSYIRKPSNFDHLTEIVEMLGEYWFHTVELPPAPLDER
jgi:CheY-like chemotaxis protein